MPTPIQPTALPGSPLQNQVFSGVTKSALTLLRMNESVDAGPIFGQIPLDLKGSIEDLFVEMTRLGNRLTKRLIADCVSGDLRFHDQDHTLATEFKRRLPSDSELIPSTVKKWRFEELEDRVNILKGPYPRAFISCESGKLEIDDVHFYKALPASCVQSAEEANLFKGQTDHNKGRIFLRVANGFALLITS